VRVRGVVGSHQLAAEELVRAADRATHPVVEHPVDTCLEGVAIDLGGQQPVARVTLLEFVDQMQLVDPVPIARILGQLMVADRAQQQQQRGQPLLSVDDDPPCQ
jgi:hypothetical protein